jgi:hypothetical protein
MGSQGDERSQHWVDSAWAIECRSYSLQAVNATEAEITKGKLDVTGGRAELGREMGVSAMTWKKGQSGNPLGEKLAFKPFSEQLRIAVNAVDPKDPEHRKKLRRIAEKLTERALAGEGWAIHRVGWGWPKGALNEPVHGL